MCRDIRVGAVAVAETVGTVVATAEVGIVVVAGSEEE